MTDEKQNVHLTQDDMAIVEGQMGRLDQILEQLIPVADSASSMMVAAEGTHHALQDQIDALKQRADTDDNQDGQLDAQVEAISSAMADLSAHVAMLQDLVSTAGSQIEALRGTNHGEHSALLQQLDELDVDTAALQGALATTQADLVAVSTKANAAATKASVDALTATVVNKANASAVQGLADRTFSAEQAIASLQTRVSALEGKQLWTGDFRYTLPTQILSGASQDITVTWPTPAQNTNYVALAGIAVAATLLGQVSASVKPGSKTTTGCVVTIKNGSLLGLAVGTELSVIAVGR